MLERTLEVPINPPECIPGDEFNEVLFDLCRNDDYRGLYREFMRLIEGSRCK